MAARQADAKKAPPEYWTYPPFTIVLVLTVTPAVTLAVLDQVFGTAFSPLLMALLVAMQELMFAVTFSR